MYYSLLSKFGPLHQTRSVRRAAVKTQREVTKLIGQDNTQSCIAQKSSLRVAERMDLIIALQTKTASIALVFKEDVSISIFGGLF